MNSYVGLGLASGSSLDGLDIICMEFVGDKSIGQFWPCFIEGHTFPYDDAWRERLANAHTLTGLELIRLHYDYAHFMGRKIEEFMVKLAEEQPEAENDRKLKFDYVGVGGHTVFHQPDHKLTFQLGDGEVLSTYLTCQLFTNFRVKNVCLGGQGAPLDGCVDPHLFNSVGLCLNLGGMAALQVRANKNCWDVCACNTVLNRLAQLNDPQALFDTNGELASKGQIRENVLQALMDLKVPRSLSIEWIHDHLWPILDSENYSLADLARTYVEYIALRVCDACVKGSAVYSPQKHHEHGRYAVLITGGGAHNQVLMKNIKEKLQAQGITLDKDLAEPAIVNFKDAVSFAFLAFRCKNGKTNVFSDATGAIQDSISGSMHQPQRALGLRTFYPRSPSVLPRT